MKEVVGDVMFRSRKEDARVNVWHPRHAVVSVIMNVQQGATVVQWNHARFWVRGVSKRMGLNPVHGPNTPL
ncbi:hypothetical protein E2C01_034296 [Portunus trituberculatus]|uniref:Uncharacterized protein n=1 Tax=Portunus trituberculatus TaxID=210409 RepID=A0A5B7F0B6_PORTR|nr:hypothetical protein [Portunus trituberculatus]